MNKIKEFDQSTVQELSKIHAVKNEYDLFTELKSAQLRYEFLSKFMPKSITPHKNKAKEVIKRSKKLMKSIDEFQDEILGLDKIDNEWLLLINSFCHDQDFEKIRSGANRTLIQAEEFLDRQQPSKRGPDSDFSLGCLINSLMYTYREATGKDIGVSKSDTTKQHTGPMFRFIKDHLNLLIIHDLNDNAIFHIIDVERKKGLTDDKCTF